MSLMSDHLRARRRIERCGIPLPEPPPSREYSLYQDATKLLNQAADLHDEAERLTLVRLSVARREREKVANQTPC